MGFVCVFICIYTSLCVCICCVRANHFFITASGKKVFLGEDYFEGGQGKSWAYSRLLLLFPSMQGSSVTLTVQIYKGAEWSDVTQQELCAMTGLGVSHTRMGVNQQLCCMAVIPQHLWSCISFEFPVEPEPLLAWEG